MRKMKIEYRPIGVVHSPVHGELPITRLWAIETGVPNVNSIRRDLTDLWVANSNLCLKTSDSEGLPPRAGYPALPLQERPVHPLRGSPDHDRKPPATWRREGRCRMGAVRPAHGCVVGNSPCAGKVASGPLGHEQDDDLHPAENRVYPAAPYGIRRSLPSARMEKGNQDADLDRGAAQPPHHTRRSAHFT